MSAVNAAQVAVVSLELPVDRDAWSAWLTQRIAPDWRPGEWDSSLLLFNGDPDNPATSIYLCTVPGCALPTSKRNGPCSSCDNRMKRGGMSAEELTPLDNWWHTRTRSLLRGGGHLEQCTVAHGGTRCERDESRQGLCESHLGIWGRYSIENPDAVLAEWAARIAVPKKAFGPCVVLGCRASSAHGRTQPLCTTHTTRWTEKRRRRGLTCTLEQWASRQAPTMGVNQFSLAPLAPLVRLEMLYGIQQRDRRGRRMQPPVMRYLVNELAASDTLVTHPGTFSGRTGFNVAREFVRWAKSAYEEFLGLNPGHDGTLDMMTIGVRSSLTRSGVPERAGTVSMDGVEQQWLRDLLVAWLRIEKPPSTDFRATLKSCLIASATLALRPGGGHDPGTLGVADMDAVVQAYIHATKEDGVTLLGRNTRQQRRRLFGELLVWGRRADVLDHLPGKFAMQVYHRIPMVVETEEDEAGKAIPEYVIRQLDDHLDDIARGWGYGLLSTEDVTHMMRTAYIVCRDTGRRPREFCGLAEDCLKYDGGEYQLVWDNVKGKRLKRLLPIESRTAEAILAWQRRRREVDHLFPAHTAGYLFPSDSEIVKCPHLATHEFGRMLRAWVDAIPAIDSDVPGEDGRPVPFDRSKIFAYAFRSSFAQRHADAGTDIDVLMALMDHKEATTTMGYYRVTIERKRKAVESLRVHSVNRRGDAAPFSSATSYEAKSVAVPFGNCVEPSNVKAGGKKCAIRFQCAGCGFYRPDPSYLPAIEDHIRSLKADREMAVAMGADDFVLRNFADQIAAFRGVVERMNTRMEQLPEDVRSEIEDASRVLRKVRAGGTRALLPLTVVNSPEAER